jgi:hypothetical protein
MDWLLSEDAAEFSKDAWGRSWRDGLPDSKGEAWLGYVTLALGATRTLDDRYADIHDALVHSLVARIVNDPWLETYPGERYPADIASVLGAIGLHGATTGQVHPELAPALAHFRESIDPSSGLLHQAVGPHGQGWDQPRASGTALAAYFLSFADQELSAELYDSVSEQSRTKLGFGGIREYPPGVAGGGDIDSGPVLFGISPSATGFAAAGARIHGDQATYLSIYRTSHIGLPTRRGWRSGYLMVGPLANAIMLSMFTAGAIPSTPSYLGQSSLAPI